MTSVIWEFNFSNTTFIFELCTCIQVSTAALLLPENLTSPKYPLDVIFAYDIHKRVGTKAPWIASAFVLSDTDRILAGFE
jgi:hypothetical protein